MSYSARIDVLVPHSTEMGRSRFYLNGFRDARHAAAEIADEADATIADLVAALRDAECGLVIAGADKPHVGDFVPTPKLALQQVRAALARAKGQA